MDLEIFLVFKDQIDGWIQMTDSTKSSKPAADRTLNPEDINYALSLLSDEGDPRPSFKAGLLSVVSYMMFGLLGTSFVTGLVTVWFNGVVGRNFFIIAGVSLLLFGVFSILETSMQEGEGDILRWRESELGKAVEAVWEEKDRSWIAGCFLIVFIFVSLGGIGWFTYVLETTDTILIPGLIMIFLPTVIVIGIMGYLFLKEEMFIAQAYHLRDKLESFQHLTEAGDSGTVSSRDYQILSQIEQIQLKKTTAKVSQASYEHEKYGILISPEAMETMETQDDFIQVRQLTSLLEANAHLEDASPVPERPGEWIIQQNNYQVTYHVDEDLRRVEILSVVRQERGEN